MWPEQECMVFWAVTGSGRPRSTPTDRVPGFNRVNHTYASGSHRVNRACQVACWGGPQVRPALRPGEPCIVGADLDRPPVPPGTTPYGRLPGRWLNEYVARALRATHPCAKRDPSDLVMFSALSHRIEYVQPCGRPEAHACSKTKKGRVSGLFIQGRDPARHAQRGGK